MKIISKIKESLKFWNKIDIVQGQMDDVTTDLARVRQQVETMQQQVSLTQHMVAEARSDIAEMKKKISGIPASLLTLRYHTCIRGGQAAPSTAKLNDNLSISAQFDRLQQLAPHAYEKWYPLLKVNEVAYSEFPVDSCSVPGHPMATLFQFFLAPYLKGRVLDIGCGPQPVPTYLEDCPADAIYGIDPLSDPNDHPFHFIKGFAEYLPWVDSQFKLVVAATTLDHVLLLDKVLREVRRVLKEDGIFAVWVGFVPGSKPYDPYRQDIELVDNYHLFHLDREWFLDAIKPFFSIFEEFPVDLMNYFFAFRPKKSALH